jgi:hypothetical protein
LDGLLRAALFACVRAPLAVVGEIARAAGLSGALLTRGWLVTARLAAVALLATLLAGFRCAIAIVGEIARTAVLSGALLTRGRLVTARLAAVALLATLLAGFRRAIAIVGEIARAAVLRTGALLIVCHVDSSSGDTGEQPVPATIKKGIDQEIVPNFPKYFFEYFSLPNFFYL